MEFIEDRVLSVQRVALSAQQVGSPDSFHTATSQEEDEDIKGSDMEETDSPLINSPDGQSQECDHRLHFAIILQGTFLP